MDPKTATVSRETVEQALLACLKESLFQWKNWKISEGLLPKADKIFGALSEGTIDNQEAIDSLLDIEKEILRRKSSFYGCNFN